MEIEFDKEEIIVGIRIAQYRESITASMSNGIVH